MQQSPTKYSIVKAIIEPKNQYIWAGQQVFNGRLRYRIFGMKMMVGGSLFVMCIQLIIDYFMSDSINQMLFSDTVIQITALIALIVFTGIGWRIGASFDEQSVELEAILKTLGFNKPSMASLNDFSVSSINRKNKINMDEYPDRWEQYTYRLDLAKQYDEEKYGKK